jgi:hypothetical protein
MLFADKRPDFAHRKGTLIGKQATRKSFAAQRVERIEISQTAHRISTQLLSAPA